MKTVSLSPATVIYFASTLPELFVAICSERKTERVNSEFRRLN